MPRLIDADEFEKRCMFSKEVYKKVDDDGLYAVLEELRMTPTIDAEPVRHGHWIEGNNFHWYSNSCSCCGYTRTTDIKSNGWNQWKYCPMCGAKMDEVKDEESV